MSNRGCRPLSMNTGQLLCHQPWQPPCRNYCTGQALSLLYSPIYS
jgi:hypothetical protein